MILTLKAKHPGVSYDDTQKTITYGAPTKSKNKNTPWRDEYRYTYKKKCSCGRTHTVHMLVVVDLYGSKIGAKAPGVITAYDEGTGFHWPWVLVKEGLFYAAA